MLIEVCSFTGVKLYICGKLFGKVEDNNAFICSVLSGNVSYCNLSPTVMWEVGRFLSECIWPYKRPFKLWLNVANGVMLVCTPAQ